MASIQTTEIDGLERCPQCGIAHPRVTIQSRHHSNMRHYALAFCASCGGGILAISDLRDENQLNGRIEYIYPSQQHVAEELPERTKNYLSQAITSLHAPDGAVMLAGSAVDAMLKDKNLEEGTVYTRIDQAVEQGILTQEMGDWAHEVRLGSNRPRHADRENPHVTREQAEQAIEFTRTLGHILYVLPRRVEKGKAKATETEAPEG